MTPVQGVLVLEAEFSAHTGVPTGEDLRAWYQVGHNGVVEIHVHDEGVAVHRCEECPYTMLYPWHRVLVVESYSTEDEA